MAFERLRPAGGFPNCPRLHGAGTMACADCLAGDRPAERDRRRAAEDRHLSHQHSHLRPVSANHQRADDHGGVELRARLPCARIRCGLLRRRGPGSSRHVDPRGHQERIVAFTKSSFLKVRAGRVLAFFRRKSLDCGSMQRSVFGGSRGL